MVPSGAFGCMINSFSLDRTLALSLSMNSLSFGRTLSLYELSLSELSFSLFELSLSRQDGFSMQAIQSPTAPRSDFLFNMFGRLGLSPTLIASIDRLYLRIQWGLEPFCTFRALKLFDVCQTSFRWTASEIKSIKGPDEHPTPYTLLPTPHTLHPTPCTLHPTPHTLHPTPCSLNPKPQIGLSVASPLNSPRCSPRRAERRPERSR